MEHSLTTAEQRILNTVQMSGAGSINSADQIDLLIQGMLKASKFTYDSVMNAVKEDRTLCKAISKRMTDLADKVVDGNNKSAEAIYDTCKANCEAIRNFMNNHEVSEQFIAECFEQLRYYSQAMLDIEQKQLTGNQEMAYRAVDAHEEVLDRSKKNRNIVIGAGAAIGGAAILYGCVKLIKELTKNN